LEPGHPNGFSPEQFNRIVGEFHERFLLLLGARDTDGMEHRPSDKISPIRVT
jgi:hypothetical protein